MTTKVLDAADYYDRDLAAWARTWNELTQTQQSGAALPLHPLSDAQRDHLERLYPLIADDLRRLAAAPKYRWLGETLQERALVLFEFLVMDLATKQHNLSVDGNLHALFTIITSRRSIDEFRIQQRRSDQDVQLTNADSLESIESDPDEAIFKKLYETAVIQAAREYWETLSWPDGEIMRLRHDTSTSYPRTFDSIAARLGPKVKANTVSKTYNRILDRTRDHLRKRGLLDDKGE